MALNKDGVWGIVCGTEEVPAGDANPKELERYVPRRDKVLATVVLSVDPSLFTKLGIQLTQLLFGRNWKNSIRRSRGSIN